MRSPRSRRLACFALCAAVAGCDGPATLTQRLTGEWVGRPESAAERVAREWPTGAPAEGDPPDPELEAAIRAEPPSDIETLADQRVTMRLLADGSAELSLEGASSQSGVWVVEAGEGRRAMLDLTTSPEADGGEAVRRRFVVEFLDSEGFTLREQGADRRFGRLLFLPANPP